jgi:hypothetical protein
MPKMLAVDRDELQLQNILVPSTSPSSAKRTEIDENLIILSSSSSSCSSFASLFVAICCAASV